MSTPTTDIEICNLALDRLGQRAITSISTPVNTTEDVCARHYDTTRRELLRRYIFNNAKKYLTLTKSATKIPAFGFTSAFLLPNDFVRLLAIGDITLNADLAAQLYDISEGFIFTSSASKDDGNSLNISYIFDFKKVSQFDSLFVRVLTLRLAANMAYKFTLRSSIIREIRDDLADAELAAAAVAGQEKPPRRIQRSRFRDVRRQGGRFRDNSRV